MKFDTPAGKNPIDQLKVVGRATSRIDGRLKTTGTAPYAYERHDVAKNQAYGFVVGAAIAKGRITAMDVAAAKAAPGVLAVVTTLDHAAPLPLGMMNAALSLAAIKWCITIRRSPWWWPTASSRPAPPPP
jgi:xanthine dehydrogenase YagR molybdenum-binding subunit